MPRKAVRRCLGIIGGLGSIAGADMYFKLVKARAANEAPENLDLTIEQHAFDEGSQGSDGMSGGAQANQNGRKLYIFDMIRRFESRKVDSVILPCFISHTFIDELRPDIRLPVVNMMEALKAHIGRRHPDKCRLGILTSDYVRSKRLFERTFDAAGYALLYPGADVQEACVMPAIYGPEGLKAGNLQGAAVDLLADACRDLLLQGAELIVPGATEIAIVADALQERGIPILDVNRIYALHALSCEGDAPSKPFKVGILGGVGPAATVDFMDKIIRNTDAVRDQDHIRLVVEHNPAIPDRTGNLVGDGPDPTVAMYAACKKLEAADADLIAIPCNTAHAFVERIQPYLSIPIVNMLVETVKHISLHYGHDKTVGLLATSGTIASRVYHDEFAKAGFDLVVPDNEHQQGVMNAIYGEQGVKAGYRDGCCRDELMQALAHLVARGAEVVVLGCTELPLLLSQDDRFPVAGRHVALLDPTDILARSCVGYARGGKKA
ncbi:aspartate/glutamate racemase family protein [Noviherbaspirillum sp.]|uniref:aspartate/glutamate racemase family protein n=1 Tax=Noviherbaspirillum sp. TaxID=1926288 RepID=UPI002FE2B944